MGKFILLVIGFGLLAAFPILIVLIGIFLAGYSFCCGDISKLFRIFTPEKRDPKPKQEEKKDEFNMDDWDPVKEAEKAVEENLKPGYKDDPKWQEQTKDISKIVDENIKKAQFEEEIEKLELQKTLGLLSQLPKKRKPTPNDPIPTRAPTKPTMTVQNPPLEMTEQEIHDVMRELNDTF